MGENIKKYIALIRGNGRFFWAFLVLIIVFLINSSFPAEIITSESCSGGKCKTAIEDPPLSDKNHSFYANDVFGSKSGEYYRLIFQVRANQKTSIDCFITNILDRDKKIGSFAIEKTNVNIAKEIIFKADEEYSDLLFKKVSAIDGADVSFGQFNLSRLNITNESEITSLSQTILGEADMTAEDQKQTTNDFSFEQLKEPKLLFGQIFTPKINYITGVSLDIDIVKQSNSGGKKYVLELREVDMKSDIPNIKSDSLASLGFSVNDMEKYRQEDGKFLFPLLAKLDPDKFYFIGINNDKVEVNKFNYLILKGSSDKNSYSEGQLAVKYQKQSFLAVGNLYFKTFGFEVKKYNDIAILPGAIIEDLGKEKIQFSYKPLESDYKLINLFSKTSDIYFDSDKKALAGEIKDGEESYFIYKFETVYPFKNFSIFADQADLTWNKSRLSYSFDNESWQEIPSSILKDRNNQERQNFNFKFLEKSLVKKEVYIKIEPENDKYPEQEKFGLKDFEFKADLIVKR